LIYRLQSNITEVVYVQGTDGWGENHSYRVLYKQLTIFCVANTDKLKNMYKTVKLNARKGARQKTDNRQVTNIQCVDV
jgi:hypothetical protein